MYFEMRFLQSYPSYIYTSSQINNSPTVLFILIRVPFSIRNPTPPFLPPTAD